MESTRKQANHGGLRLDAGVRRLLEDAFDIDLASVRVHTGTRADAVARSMHADAFAVGPRLYFREGAYDPASEHGLWLLAHEIAHVTQQHVLRGAEKAQRDSLPILLATLGAIIAAQQAGGNSSGDASQAALVTGLGLLQQRQIDYTRDNEAEADRVGIRTLANGGFAPEAMAEFFETLQAVVRVNQGDERSRVPGYLQTHPVTLSRISEARERAAKLEVGNATGSTAIATNPLLRKKKKRKL